LTQEQKNGDFSKVRRQLIDPVSKAPFPNNQIPSNRVDPIVTKLLPLVPAATSADGLITYAVPVSEHENQFMGRMDYNLTRQRLYGRYFYAKYPRQAYAGGGNLVASRGGFEFFDQSASVGHTFSITPNIVNSFIASWNYNDGNAR